MRQIHMAFFPLHQFRRRLRRAGRRFRCKPRPASRRSARNQDSVGKYEKLELTVALTATYENPYDPDQIDLSAEFTSPAGKVWKVNGFYGADQMATPSAPNGTGRAGRRDVDQFRVENPLRGQ